MNSSTNTIHISLHDLIHLCFKTYKLLPNEILLNNQYILLQEPLYGNSNLHVYVNESCHTLVLIASPTNSTISHLLCNKSKTNDLSLILPKLIRYVTKRSKEYDQVIKRILTTYPKSKYHYIFVGFSLGATLHSSVFEKMDTVYFVNPLLTPFQVFESKWTCNAHQHIIFRTSFDMVSTFTQLNNQLNVITIPSKQIFYYESEDDHVHSQKNHHTILNFTDVFIDLPC